MYVSKRYSNKTTLQMSPNPGKEKLIPSLFHPVTAYESDQKVLILSWT